MERPVRKAIFTSLVLLLGFALPSFGQSAGQPAAQPAGQPPVQSIESLLLGPGDLITVTVFDTPEMNQEVRVSDSGEVRLQLVGDVKVGGQTAGAAAKSIEDALISHNIMKVPQVTVKVKDFATQNVSVLGQVKNPGPYEITTPQTVLKVIALAGGLNEDADRKITIQRHDQPDQRVEYYMANNADLAVKNSVMVNPGDTVIVPRAPVVYVLGDVARPGGYTIATNDSKLTMLQLISMAGSTNKTSKSNLRLIRKEADGQQKEIPVQLASIQKGKQPDIQLQQGDIVFVPFSWMKNTAMSAANIAASATGASIYMIH
jgi:polysaccharide export outer membrane protein